MRSCLFCGTHCPPKFTVVNGHVRKLKLDNDQRNSTSSPPSTSASSTLNFGREDSVIGDQLNVIFILRNILKIEKAKLCQFLKISGNHLHPEHWIRVCSSCEKIVGMFYQTVKDIAKLKLKLVGFSNELKTRIQKSKYKEETGPTGRFWKEIREEVLTEKTDDFFEGVEEKPLNTVASKVSSSESEYDSEEDEDYKETSHDDDDDDDDDDEDYAPISKRNRMSQNFVSIANNKNVSISTPTTQVIPPMPMPRREIKLIGKSEVISLNSVKVAVKKELNLVPENEEFQENVATVSATSFDPSSLFLKPQYDDLVPGPSHLQNDLLNSSQPSYLTSEDDATSSSSNQTNVIRMLDDSDPRCSKFYRGRLRRYACRICIAEENSLKMLLVHLQLHEEGSGAIPCPECGWFVMPNKLQHHHGHHHKHLRRKPPKTTPKLWYYQCPECNALLTQIERYREHEAMHEQGEGVICPEEGCGWLVKVLGMHRERWHLKDGEATRYKVKHSRKIKIMKKRIHKPLTTPMAKPRRKKKKAGNAVEQKLMSQPALAVLPDF